jgi:prepilin peptidase CpaA
VLATFQGLAFLIFPAAMIWAAISDLMTMTIANRLVAGLLVSFLVLAPLAGMDLHALGLHFAAAGIVLAVGFFCFAMGWIGGGDAKFAAVTVLWLGWDQALSFVALASLLGGALTLFVLSFRRAVLPAAVVRLPWVARLHDDRSGVPYGVALAAAGVVIYPSTVWVQMALA